MIVRDGDDTIEFCLESVLPYVKRAIVTVDSRTEDRTRDVLAGIKARWNNLEVREFAIENPAIDLVEMRNSQLIGVREPYIWIIDADEYYPKSAIEKIRFSDMFETYAFQCWAIWGKDKAHWSSSKPQIARIFKNDGRRWRGKFGKEILRSEGDRMKLLGLRYVHLTHIKKDGWRKEMGKERVADGKHLIPIPQDVINIVNNFYDKKHNVQNVRGN